MLFYVLKYKLNICGSLSEGFFRGINNVGKEWKAALFLGFIL